MNPLWDYLWPAFSAGLLAGAVGGIAGFRRKRLAIPLVVAALLALGAAALWHGPLGAADRFTTVVERDARDALKDLEMTRVSAALHRGPLSRRLILTKPADLALDDFQTAEIARLMGQVSGVSRATWAKDDAGLPLLAEGALAALGGFLVGLLLAYLLELHRRYNAQWKW
jgi:hypothetical protein